MTTPTPTDLPEALRLAIADAVGIMRTYQTNLGSSQDTCDKNGARMWAEIDRTCAALAAPTTEQSSEVARADEAADETRDLLITTLHVLAMGRYEGPAKDDAGMLANSIKEYLQAPTAPQAGAESYPPMPEPTLESTQCDSTMRYTTLRSYSDRQLLEFADATAALRARGSVPSDVPEGFAVVYVKGFDDLLVALSHAERKGDLPHNVQVRWDGFDYRKPAAPQPPAALPGEQDAAPRPTLPAIKDMQNGPKQLNLNDRAFWVLGWNECRDAVRDAVIAPKGRTDGGEPNA